MLTRAETRRKLATIVKGAVPELVEVYSYKVADTQGRSPVMAIASGGFRPQQLAADAYWTSYFFALNVLTLYSDVESGWTEEMAEDMNDTIVEKTIAALFEVRVTQWWNSITVENRTIVDEVHIGGVTYLNEVIPISVEMVP